MNSITKFLDLEDSEIYISDIHTQDTTKTITLEIPITVHHCPSCGYRMHSRGIKQRTIQHPILQDGYELILLLKQRRWRCTNPDCKYEMNDSFRFVNKHRRVTNATDMLIVQAYQNLSESSASIARRFHVSDAHVHDVFDRYVKLDRLPLTDIICIDEVHVDLDDHCKYALVIQDFYTGDPIDLLRSRRKDVTEPYFANLPVEEKNRVKYLISDMYNQYISYVDKYFPNAVSVIDSFHVTQWIVHSIDNYCKQLLKKYKQRDRELAEQLSADKNREIKVPISHEVHLLQKYRWLILSNRSNLTYHTDLRMDQHFRRMMNTYDYETEFFKIDSNLKEFRDLKELYITFNSRNAGNPLNAATELSELIAKYRQCPHTIFHDFANLLERHKEPIINSFVMVQKHGNGRIYSSRLSNGPMESMNRKAKDLKRLGRGFTNFEHYRNRFLYASRNNPVLDGIEHHSQVQYYESDDDSFLD